MALVKKAGVTEKPPVRAMQADLEAAMTRESHAVGGSRLATESQKRKARTFAR
ncbi:hypothetical protein A33M_3945 [Rhodovulum sp. PH10]|uniref:hypothetical protein n=1 Tax=Rhodovulum sp. PH10 TaxID=1187851 RepID=UPI00027C2218|nr:hypothetical protein [Rhodovulum sp. PH10]EJW10876.1 hypothetical protein A33M_3945 [Rhodovulum sp. PH10]